MGSYTILLIWDIYWIRLQISTKNLQEEPFCSLNAQKISVAEIFLKPRLSGDNIKKAEISAFKLISGVYAPSMKKWGARNPT